MIENIKIENYKSIQELEFSLGRITVLIGANGSGKSNILEAIALSAAAANDKLDNEFLVSRGIRVTDDPQFMRSAFIKKNVTKEIRTIIKGKDLKVETALQKKNDDSYSSWYDNGDKPLDEVDIEEYVKKLPVKFVSSHNLPSFIKKNKIKTLADLISVTDTDDKDLFLKILSILSEKDITAIFRSVTKKRIEPLCLHEFLIYSPENSSLRTFEQEGQIQPLGIKGEGLFKLLKILSLKKNKKQLDEIKSKLKFIDWFSDFDVANDLSPQERRIQIKDKYLDSKLEYFDQKSSNEGFLFLLFYLCLFVSNDTPNFFAIDNIDASLNPKLCSRLMVELAELAKKYKKQVIITTHNPAILDGLNLNDENQKLYVITRNKLGHTKAKQFTKPKLIEGQEPVRLSEAFLRGYLGGLPQNF